MKLVREHLNEIKQNIEKSGLGVIGLGKESIIKKWLEKKIDANQISYRYDSTQSRIDSDGYLYSDHIDVRMTDVKNAPIILNKEHLKNVRRIRCIDCMFDRNGDIVPRSREDFIKAVTYDIKDNHTKAFSYDFVNHYLYYVALKFIASFGSKGVKDSEVINKIKKMAYPNLDPEKIGYWEAVFQARNNTPVSIGTTRIAPRTYRINRDGLNYIEDHEYLFEK